MPDTNKTPDRPAVLIARGRDAADVIRFYPMSLSRAKTCWAGFKVVTVRIGSDPTALTGFRQTGSRRCEF